MSEARRIHVLSRNPLADNKIDFSPENLNTLTSDGPQLTEFVAAFNKVRF